MNATTLMEMQGKGILSVRVSLPCVDWPFSFPYRNLSGKRNKLQEDETSVEGINAKLKELQKELLRLANAKRNMAAWRRRLTACVT